MKITPAGQATHERVMLVAQLYGGIDLEVRENGGLLHVDLVFTTVILAVGFARVMIEQRGAVVDYADNVEVPGSLFDPATLCVTVRV